MIAGIFHQGSGLGNQLHRYVATRVLAADKGYKWGMMGSALFKGDSFMKIDKGYIDFGIQNNTDGTRSWMFDTQRVPLIEFQEKKVVENGLDIRGYDPEINFVQDNTLIDGEFQDPRYFEHRMDDIAEWLKTEPLPTEMCVIGFRGGEYALYPELFLPERYWDLAIKKMHDINPMMEFRVVTDDPGLAHKCFPYFKVSHEIGSDWRSVRSAKYSIISNSSFYILPRLLQHHENRDSVTIAPRYWARHNTKIWALPQNYYKQFTYIHESSPDKF